MNAERVMLLVMWAALVSIFGLFRGFVDMSRKKSFAGFVVVFALVFFLLLLLSLDSCSKAAELHYQLPTETFDGFLYRTKGVTCEQITGHAEGENPSCLAIYQYHVKALDVLAPYLGPEVYNVKMDNVHYFRAARITSYVDGLPMVIPAISFAFKAGLRFPVPVFASMTITAFERYRRGRDQYEILYASEASVFCEELHRVAHEMGAPWWADAGHYEEDYPETHDDPLKFHCHDWAMSEAGK